MKRKFSILRFVKRMLTELVISFAVLTLSVLGYYLIFHVPPGAKMIVKPPPITTSNLESNQARFMFFYTPWCPWCKKAQPAWSSFKEMLKNSKYSYGGKDILFEDINVESDKGKAALYQIEAYPTFKLETSEKVFEMVGKPSVASFRAFLTSALGSEKVTH